jgi:transposase-like protein
MEKRRHFTPEEKAKIVIEVLREEKTLNEIESAKPLEGRIHKQCRQGIQQGN